MKKSRCWQCRITQTVKILIAFYCCFSAFAQATGLPCDIETVISVQVTSKNLLKSTKEQSKSEEKCETVGCIKAALQVISYLNESVDPCDNFYEFACGTYLKNTVIPQDEDAVDAYSDIENMVKERIDTILSEPLQPDEPKAFQLAKNFNFACLNETVIEERGIQPLVDIFEELGGWPVVEGDLWTDNNWNWIDVIKKFRIMGLNTDVIFKVTTDPDLKKSTQYVLCIYQTDLGLEREFLLKGIDNEFVQNYYNSMVENAMIFGANKTQAEAELYDALEFEMKLASISLARERLRNDSNLYNPYTIKELQDAYPYLNWLDYISALFPSDVKVTENETVINSMPSFFKQLENILNSTSKRTIANYLIWRVVHTTSGTLTSELRKQRFEMKNTARWKECIELTRQNLPIAVGALYVRRYFNEEARQAAIDVMEDIREAFIYILYKVPWMDEKTRMEAIKKAKLVVAHIGYPNELNDDNKLEEYYNGLEIESNNLLLNTLRVKIFQTDSSFKKLRETVNKTDWRTHSIPAEVNAFYIDSENSVQLPAGILQGLFFSADRPHYMNYASLGSIFGHELTHGFDDEGRLYNSEGNLVDWWQSKTQKQFLEMLDCIIEQYGNYTDLKSNLTLDGVNTQGENIADNGGAKEAYFAYNKWVQRNAPEGLLPGLKYDQQQLFWIALAQSSCTASDDDTYIITADDHAPDEFRVNGVVSNMPDFANDFNCPTDSKMNPTKKCSIW